MGSGTSRPEQDIQSGGSDQTFFANRDQPVQFSETLINHLSNSNNSPSTSSSAAVPTSRQQALDSHIQAKIQQELKQLRQQEQQVRQEIERALEKENLDRERGTTGEQGGNSSLSHSASLLQDLKRLEQRSQGLKKERGETSEWKQVEQGKKALEKCFLENPKTPLECRNEAEKFKAAVAGVEKAFVASIN